MKLLWSYLAPLLRYDELQAEKLGFIYPTLVRPQI